MSASTHAKRHKLTDYEESQARAIALWKSAPPHPLSELWKMVLIPAAHLLGRVLPAPLVRFSIERAYDAAEFAAGQKDIELQAGVAELSELHKRPMEECDRLATRVGIAAELLATAEGVATGSGGVWTTLLDVPLVFVLALRTIIKVGHCYGYRLDQWKDRPFVLGVFIVATSNTLEDRRARLKQLREMEQFMLVQAQVNMVSEEVLSFIFQLEIFEDIPGIGAVTGGLLNLTFMQRIEHTARRVFQERWLLDNGKIETELRPADVPARQLARGWRGAMGRAVYGGCYYAGFGAALPLWLAVRALPFTGGPALAAIGANGNGRTRTGQAAGATSARRRRARLAPS